MTTILDEETEVGQCDCDVDGTHGFQYAEPDYSLVCAHTLAVLNDKGMMRIEQQCYLRRGTAAPKQGWIKPRVVMEPSPNSPDAAKARAELTHKRFVEHIRQKFPQRYLV